MTSISLPRRMLVGGGTTREVGRLLASLGLRRPCVVTDAFQAGAHGQLSRVSDALRGHVDSWDAFADTEPDPTTTSVARCADRLRAGGFDSIVALGGGSPIDTAKAASVLAVHGGRMRDYKAPFQMDKPALPIVAVPTTAGTGSEVTRFTIVTDSDTSEKMLCVGLAYLPVAAVVDYELSLTMPYRLTADTGIDALCHAMEAFVSKRRNAFSDTFALKAISRISKSLRVACEEPGNARAREEMMLAATEAGIAFSNASVTLIHGMSRPIGALYHVPHGLSNAMLAPVVTEFSVPGAVDRYALVAKAAEFAGLGAGDEDAAEAVPRGLAALCADLRVPPLASWKGLDADPDAFERVVPKMAADAIASGSPNNNPVVPSAKQVEDLYRHIFRSRGKLAAEAGV